MLAFTYSYPGGDDTDDPGKYSMEEAIPNFGDSRYGLTAGPVFTLVFAVMVLFAGGISGLVNRVILLAVVGTLWSLTSIGTAFCKTFW